MEVPPPSTTDAVAVAVHLEEVEVPSKLSVVERNTIGGQQPHQRPEVIGPASRALGSEQCVISLLGGRCPSAHQSPHGVPEALPIAVVHLRGVASLVDAVQRQRLMHRGFRRTGLIPASDEVLWGDFERYLPHLRRVPRGFVDTLPQKSQDGACLRVSGEEPRLELRDICPGPRIQLKGGICRRHREPSVEMAPAGGGASLVVVVSGSARVFASFCRAQDSYRAEE